MTRFLTADVVGRVGAERATEAGVGSGAGSGAGSGVVGTGSSAASARLTTPATDIPHASPSAQRRQAHIASVRVQAPTAPSRRRAIGKLIFPPAEERPEAGIVRRLYLFRQGFRPIALHWAS